MTSPVARRLDRLLRWNRRYAPLIDTVIKLIPLIAAAGSILGLCLWSVFGGYLGQLGQAPLPVKDAVDWIFIPLFGAFAWLVLGVIVLAPAAWTTAVRMSAPAHVPPCVVRQACGVCAAATLLVIAVAVVVTPLMSRELTPYVPLAATAMGGLAGGAVLTRGRGPRLGVLYACLGFAGASLFLIVWSASLWIVLAPAVEPFAANRPLAAVLGLFSILAFLIAVYVTKPPVGILVGLAITCLWVRRQASPDGGTLIASALYAANLGGGRPARIDQDRVDGEVCNLGVEARQVLFFEKKGCNRQAAFRRLRTLKGLDSLARRRELVAWKVEANCHLLAPSGESAVACSNAGSGPTRGRGAQQHPKGRSNDRVAPHRRV